MSVLPAAEQRRVNDYIELEFAYERVQEEEEEEAAEAAEVARL